MYPDLYYLFYDLFHIKIPVLMHISTFGFLVALCFLTGIYFLRKELLRKEVLGILTYSEKQKTNGKIIQIWPSDRVGDVMLFSAIFGLLGGKLFYCFENWSAFVHAPFNMLTSLAGINFYGGLIFSSIALWIYFQANKIKLIIVADTIAPALMIAYAVGRIGCHLSGDGDWGIVNTSSKPFLWLPNWMWAYDYPHNVSMNGAVIPGCDWGNYCYHLVPPVFPTPFYETVICTMLFIFLWSIRKKIKVIGRLGAVYLIVNGLERFFIEKIRINPKVNFLGIHYTQAEFIAFTFILFGTILYFYAPYFKINHLINKSLKKAKE